MPLLFPLATGAVFTKDDLAALHLPLRFLYQQALHAGDFLWWTPAYHAGFFIHGAGEAGMAHPLHLALYWLLPLDVAFNLEIVSSYVFLFSGSYLMLRRLGVAIEGALLGAMTTAFSGFTLYNLMHVNHIATLAHAPWILLGCHWLMTADRLTGRTGGFIVTTLGIGSQLLSGNPQYVVMTMFPVAYLLAILAYRGHGRRLPLVAGAFAVAAMIGAVQILPTLDFLQDSTRSSWSAEQALTFSLSPANVIQLWSPFAFEYRVFAPPAEEFIVHEFIVYNGAICTLAIAWTAIRWREYRHKALATALMVFAVLALWLAFGRYGWIYQWIMLVPGATALRAPARYIVLFQFALAGLAAIAFDDMVSLVARNERLRWRRLWPLAVVAALCVITTIAAALLAGSEWAAQRGVRFSPLMRAAPWSAMVVVMVCLTTLVARGRRWAVPVMVACAVVDLGAWGYSYAYRWGTVQPMSELAAEAQVPRWSQLGDVIPPVPGGRDSLAILRGLRLTTGYTGLYMRATLDMSQPVTERLAGIKWRGDGEQWHLVEDRLPRARLLAAAKVSHTVASDLSSIDVNRIALVDSSIDLGGSPGSTKVSGDWPGRIEIETSAGGRQLLVLTERFHHGWRATVDGVAAQPIRVYADFLGAVIEAGHHHVVFDFAPDSVRRGWYLTVTGLCITLILGSVVFLRSR